MGMYEKCTVKGGDLSAKAWSPFRKRLKALTAFCDELATLLPGTATVECDFLEIGEERLPRKSYGLMSRENTAK